MWATKMVTILWTTALLLSQTAYFFSFYSKWFPELHTLPSCAVFPLPSPTPQLQWLYLLKSTRVCQANKSSYSLAVVHASSSHRKHSEVKKGSISGEANVEIFFLYPGRWMWKSSFCIRRDEILWNLSWHVEDVLKKETSPVWESALFCVEGLWACYSFLSL